MQTELERHMERLLGSRPNNSIASEEVPQSAPHSPRGAPYEEMDEGTDVSVR